MKGRFDYGPKAWVYQIYGSSGKLLYIGYTTDLFKRIGQHRQRDYRHASYIEWESFDDEAEAKAHEQQLIRRLQPWGNVRGQLVGDVF